MNRIAPELKTIRRCSKKCRLYPCLYSDLSFSDQMNGKCALKQMPHRMQNRVIRLYLKGEQGAAEELVETLLRLAEMGELQDKELLKQYYRHLIEYIKIVYGEKTKISKFIENQEQNYRTIDIIRALREINKEQEKNLAKEEAKEEGDSIG